MIRSSDLLRAMVGAAAAVAIFTSSDVEAAPRKPRKPATAPKTETVEAPPPVETQTQSTSVPAADAPKPEPQPTPAPEASSEPPREKTSIFTPPQTTWPVYVFGAVGLVGLGTAAIFGGLRANAEHSADVAGAALIRKGKPPGLCNAQPVEFAYAEICAHLQKNKRMADSHAGWVLPSLIVGATATAAALGWFFFAPKEGAGGERADKAGPPRVVPWVGVEGGGASVIGRF